MTDRDGGLDQLFSFIEEPAAEEEVLPPAETKRRWPLIIVRNVAIIAAATTVTVAGLRSAGIGVSVVLVVCAFVALRLLFAAVAQVAPPPAPGRSSGPRLTESDNDYDYRFGGTDTLRVAVRRWEQRLDWAASDDKIFSRTLRPVLAELADERLRLRHGITCESDPRRARELLGASLYELLTDPKARFPRNKDWPAYLESLERI
jgi:hypothetical protein